MPSAQLEVLLAPVSSESPCGADLEYGDPAFAELGRAVLGKPEQQIGNTVVPAAEPDWKSVEKQATQLLGRTKGSSCQRPPRERAPAYARAQWSRRRCRAAQQVGRELLGEVCILDSIPMTPRPHHARQHPGEPRGAGDSFRRPHDTARCLEARGTVASRTSKPRWRAARRAATASNRPRSRRWRWTANLSACRRSSRPPAPARERGLEAVSARVEAPTRRASASSPPWCASSGKLLGGNWERTPGEVVGGNGEAQSGGAPSAAFTGQITSREDVLKALDRIAAYYASTSRRARSRCSWSGASGW